MDFVQTNWLLLLIVMAAAIAIGWYIFHAARRTRVTGETRDVLDEGAPPAARNQALIDAPRSPAPAAKKAPAEPAAKPAKPASAKTRGTGAKTAAGGDLNRIKGVGPKLVAELEALGVTSLAQVAQWTKADIERIDSQLGRFQGRIQRDEWVEQARLLAKGDETGHAKRFGNS